MKELKELLYKMADDSLIIGHRNSEWTGLGPILEEDISFSSMAQDKIGHALSLYRILHDLGEDRPDTLAFLRDSSQFHCCHFVELPNGEYDFSLIRHFLFDHAEYQRYEMLAESSFEPLAKMAKKVKGELKYHILHADTWVKQLGRANEESNKRLQTSIDYCLPFALGIFESSPFEQHLIDTNIFGGEEVLKTKWVSSISVILMDAGLKLPDLFKTKPVLGGRAGTHTSFLQLLLDEMGEVIRSEPGAEW